MIKLTILASFLALLATHAAAKSDSLNLTNFQLQLPVDPPHAHLNVVELISLYEYEVEKHSITTGDGYVLEVHRIPGNKQNPSAKGKPAVLLEHGIMSSSMDWVIAGPQRGLAFILADAGYDVWMGNSRGNKYSRKHKNYSPDKAKFWNFSWHEIGMYDLPATIDHILEETGNEKIFYIGHGQGATLLYVLLSEHPEYNSKVTAAFSLAPMAFSSHMTSPVLKPLAKHPDILKGVTELFGLYEIKPTNKFLNEFIKKSCKNSEITHPLCTNILFILCGYSQEQLDEALLPSLLAQAPSGCSAKQFVHFTQLIKSGEFRQYDYGWWINIEKYRRILPPSYNFENIKVPVSLHYCVNDYLANSKDVEKLHSKLPNAIGKFRVPNDKFNHLDFLWAKDVKTLLYNKILNLMKRYRN